MLSAEAVAARERAAAARAGMLSFMV